MARKTVEPKPIARLVWVLHNEIVTVDAPGPNSTAAQALIDRMTERKQLTHLDIAAVAALLSLALAVDSAASDARLWAQYRQQVDVVRALDRAPVEDHGDWTAIVGAAEVRNAKESRSRNVRKTGGRGQRAPRKTTDAAPAAPVGRRSRVR